MKFRSKILMVIVACTFAVTIVSAQSTPKSLKNRATVGLYSDEVDNFASVTDWSTVSFENAFAYVNYDQTITGTNNAGTPTAPVYLPVFLSVGAATKFTKWYTAAFYNFNYDSGMANFNNTSKGRHDAGVLLGTDNKGFLIGFQANDTVGSTPNIDEVTPYFYFGSINRREDKVTKINVGVAVQIESDNENPSKTTRTNSQPQFTIKPKLAFTFGLDGVRTVAINYDPALKIATSKATDSNGGVGNGKFGFDNTLGIRFTAKKGIADKINLGFRTGTDVKINYNDVDIGYKNGFLVGLVPMVALATEITVVPGVFSVNIGVSGSYDWNVIDAKDGKIKGSDIGANLRNGNVGFTAGLGMSFIMSHNIGLDILGYVGNTYAMGWNTLYGRLPTTTIPNPTYNDANSTGNPNDIITKLAVQFKVKF